MVANHLHLRRSAETRLSGVATSTAKWPLLNWEPRFLWGDNQACEANKRLRHISAVVSDRRPLPPSFCCHMQQTWLMLHIHGCSEGLHVSLYPLRLDRVPIHGVRRDLSPAFEPDPSDAGVTFDIISLR